MIFIIGMCIIAYFFGLFTVGGGAKKGLEAISVITKLGVSLILSFAIFFLLPMNVDFLTRGLYACGGAIVICILILWLSATFRMVGYAINFAIDSCFVAFAASFVGLLTNMRFVPYVIVMLAFPRIVWFSDRDATDEVYSHTEGNVEYYEARKRDRLVNTKNSWRWLPVQVPVSFLLYVLGSTTALSYFPSNNRFLQNLFLVLSGVLNVAVDLFIIRKLETAIEKEAENPTPENE